MMTPAISLGDPSSLRLRQRSRGSRVLVLPKSTFELGKRGQSIVAEDLPPDSQRVLFAEVSSVDALNENFCQAATSHFGGAVDSLGVVGVSAPHDPAGWHHVEPFVESPLGGLVAECRHPDRVQPDVPAMPHQDDTCLANPRESTVKQD
jgi:hypothetical protein